MAGQTILLASPLPGLTEAETTIDADLGGDCIPDIGLSGQFAGPGNGLNLFAPAGGHVIRGLAIHSFAGDGIAIGSDDNTVACNRIGTDLALNPGIGNGANGIQVFIGNDNVIGPGNRIENNVGAGVRVLESAVPGAYPEFAALVPDSSGIFPSVDFSEAGGTYFRHAGGITPLDGSGRPFTENFGMRLRGELTVDTAGSYTFTIDPLDDDARLTVAGSGAHAIRLDFQEGAGIRACA